MYYLCLDFDSQIINYVATSTDVERAFSRGGLTISKLRHSLTDKSARASTIVGMWSNRDGLVPVSSIVSLFKEKKSRPKKRVKMTAAVESDGNTVNADVIHVDDD